MFIRRWCGRWHIRVALGWLLLLSFCGPGLAQVDTGSNPDLLSITSSTELRALGACLLDPGLASEIEDCFQFGALRSLGFVRLFTHLGIDVYSGSLVFGDTSTAIRLSFFYVTSPQFGTQIDYSTEVINGAPPQVIAEDMQCFDFIRWLATEGFPLASSFVDSEECGGVQIDRDLSYRIPRFTATLHGGTLPLQEFQASENSSRMLRVSASRSPALGYFDVETH